MYILILDALVNLSVWRRRGFLSELLNIEEGYFICIIWRKPLTHSEGEAVYRPSSFSGHVKSCLKQRLSWHLFIVEDGCLNAF